MEELALTPPSLRDRRPIGSIWRAWVLGALALVVCTSAAGAQRNLSVNDFQVTRYTEKDGAPTNTWVIAQTHDGWLWFGGPNGLYRFDGLRFEEVRIDSGDPTRSTAVGVLATLPSGGLLIGKGRGGLCTLEDGKLTHYDNEDTRRAGRVLDLAQDADGVLWAAAAHGLLRFDGRQWRLVGPELGFDGGAALAVRKDRFGTLWVAEESRVLALRHGKPQFEATSVEVSGAWGFLQSPDGRTWVADVKQVQVLPGQAPTDGLVPSTFSPPSNGAFFDLEGYFWQPYRDQSPGDGSPEPAVIDASSLGKRLDTGFEDREGNFWIAGGGSTIYRLRRAVVETGGALASSSIALVPDGSGTIWLGVGDAVTGATVEGLWAFDTALHRVQPDEIKVVTAMAREPNGPLWVAGREGLWRRQLDRFAPAIALPEAAKGQRVKGITPGCAGGLWVSVPPVGLMRHDGRTWQPNGNAEGLPAEMPNVQACDPGGRLWLGYANGEVVRVTDNRTVVFGPAQGLKVGAVTSLGLGALHTVVGGERGMALLDDDRVTTLKAADSRVLERSTGIVETPSGDLWTNNSSGISHIEASEIRRLRAARTAGPIAVDLFDSSDGYPGPGFSIPMSGPSAALGSDGRIWFASTQGLGWIDPAQTRRRTDTPPVFIQSLLADQTRINDIGHATLAQGTRTIEVAYTALDYAHPERLRFRYRLDGVDGTWVDAGARRLASYGNLNPGAYHFVVNVTDDRGAWTDSAAELDFVIPPTFLQSRTFTALCLAAALVVLALLYRVRVRQLTLRERLLVEGGMKERERIARDLHDTLLQGTQALVLMVHGAAKLARRGEPVHELLDEALARADDVVAEGRDRIQELRLADEGDDDLATSLARVAESLARSGPVRSQVAVEGQPRPLRPDVQQAAYRIAREAMLNAFRHAEPESVEVQLLFADESFRLRVRDDGVGIDERLVGGGSTPGHWGLPGMRERAESIGAAFDLWSRAGAGTEVELRVPAKVAYPRRAVRQRPRWSALFRREGPK